MVNKKIIYFVLIALAIVTVFFNINHAKAVWLAPADGVADNTLSNEDKLPVYFFWGDGCPHCAAEKEFWATAKNDYPRIDWIAYETWSNEKNYELLKKTMQEKTGKASGAVPVTIIGDEVIVGFRDADTTGIKIRQALNVYIAKNDLTNTNNVDDQEVGEYEETIKYPLIGKIKLNKLSLPALTVVLGTLDGFNPCSMWALIVLITLLLNTGSRKKMWIVGSIFIIASAISYFIFLTAWFNAFLKIGYLTGVRIGIGILALTVGIYFIYDYIKKRKQDEVVCEVANSETKNKLITKLQNTLKKKSMWAMIVGVVVVAFSVNLIELMCSAGIPAIYTQILSQNNLSSSGYYLYLLGYDFFYMLDDIVVLLIAGFTWKIAMSTAKYTKYSHLIGGILLFILGLIMLINPNLLMVG